MLNTSVLFQRSYTTCVRGISILLIAIFHVLLTWDGMPRYINLTGSVCVAAFLFLSGFGIHESYKKYGLTNYWFKRFKRIILPYTLFITALIPFTDDFSWKDYLLDITYLHSSYWFIEFVVWNYVVYWIAQRFFQKHLLQVFLLFGILFLNVLMQMEAEQAFSFVAGVWASQHIERLRGIEVSKVMFFTIVSFLFGFFFLLLKEIPSVHSYKGTLLYSYILLCIKMPMAISLIVLPFFIPILLHFRLLYLAGISSLEIYLVHLSMLDMIDMNYLNLFYYVCLTVLLTYLFYQVNQFILRWK